MLALRRKRYDKNSCCGRKLTNRIYRNKHRFFSDNDIKKNRNKGDGP